MEQLEIGAALWKGAVEWGTSLCECRIGHSVDALKTNGPRGGHEPATSYWQHHDRHWFGFERWQCGGRRRPTALAADLLFPASQTPEANVGLDTLNRRVKFIIQTKQESKTKVLN